MFIITGGGSGIGRALAKTLADRGKDVLIIGRRMPMLEETALYSPHISLLGADVSSIVGRRHIIEHVGSLEKPIEGLIHSAGVIGPLELLGDIQLNDWQTCLDTNLTAPLFLTQALLPQLAGGRVLHIGSALAYYPGHALGAYCVSKAALAMLTRCWRFDNQKTLFSSVMPGVVDTDMILLISQSPNISQQRDDYFRRLRDENRLMDPETAGLFLSYLLLDVPAADYSAKEWDIYDTSHHGDWLVPPHVVPSLII